MRVGQGINHQSHQRVCIACCSLAVVWIELYLANGYGQARRTSKAMAAVDPARVGMSVEKAG